MTRLDLPHISDYGIIEYFRLMYMRHHYISLESNVKEIYWNIKYFLYPIRCVENVQKPINF